MRFIGESKSNVVASAEAPFGDVSIDASPCYDFLISLRALYNVQAYDRARQWTTAARKSMSPDLLDRGRVYFQGGDTGLALGLLPLISDLPDEAQPRDFLTHLKNVSAEEFALRMLDTGELATPALDFYSHVLASPEHTEDSDFEGRVRQYAGSLTDRCISVLRDPQRAQDDLVLFLEDYLQGPFASDIESIAQAVQRAGSSANDLLEMQPTVASVEALTGGYTLSSAARMSYTILAPSIFIYPYMASRIDEKSGRALIVFGIRNDEILGYRGSSTEDVLLSVKALAHAHRLEILSMLRERPYLGVDLVKQLKLAQPTVHHHLALLRSAGLIRQERTGDGMLYTMKPLGAESTIDRLGTFLGIGDN